MWTSLKNKLKNTWVFLKNFILNPRTTGSIFPSSKHLANEMVSHALKNKHGIILELGGGTGVVTESLLQHGISPEDIVVVECSAEFVKKLKSDFPQIKIINGNAENLMLLLANEKRNINVIISSLPLRSLPKSTARLILDQIKNILAVNGKYIQFTYSFRKDHFYSLIGYRHVMSKRVWLNLPPARVDVWTK